MPACFIELYNPWMTQYSELSTTTATEQINAPAAAEVPGEFYYDSTNPANSAYAPYSTYPIGPTARGRRSE